MSDLFTASYPVLSAEQKMKSYLQVLQLVASGWMMVGVTIEASGGAIARHWPSHASALGMIGLCSSMIALAMFSLLIPFSYINRRKS